jgi:hypothetical protein
MKDGIVECVFFWLLFAQAYRKKEMRMSFIGSSSDKCVHAQFHPAEQGDGNPASTAANRVQNPRTPGASS